MIYNFLYKSVFSHIDPETIHDVCLKLIEVTGNVPILYALVRKTWGSNPKVTSSKRVEAIFGKSIPGFLGLAAGMDKEGRAVLGLDALGFSFIEVGTFTARPQPGNDKPRMWRYPADKAIRNKMGFNNSGADAAAARLRKLRSSTRGKKIVIGANIGKTKVVALNDAVTDYSYSAEKVAPWVDYLVVNVSSPNTPDLRKLQAVESLRPILKAVSKASAEAAHKPVPLLVKIAPDLSNEDIDAVANLVLEMHLAGIVATNTTIKHNLGEGGLSGKPLLPRSLEVVRRLRKRLGNKAIIIGVGGISNATDGELMLAAGADLLQAYTAFIYNGPAWPGRVNRALAKKLMCSNP